MKDSPMAPSIAQIFMGVLLQPHDSDKRADTPPWQENLAIDLPMLRTPNPTLRPCDANLATFRPCDAHIAVGKLR